MKFLTEQQLAEHAAATRRGVLEGTLAGGSVALAGSYYMNRTWPAYRSFPLSIKALGIIMIVAPCFAIQGERRGLEYDRSQWEGETLRVLDEQRLQGEKKWEAMPTQEKLADWVARHQYTVILGSWATSLGIAGAIIARQKYQPFSQKIVQARMWAQGLTIGVLLAAGAVTHSRRKLFAEERQHDHSWEDILKQQERDRMENERLGITIPATGPHGTREGYNARLGHL